MVSYYIILMFLKKRKKMIQIQWLCGACMFVYAVSVYVFQVQGLADRYRYKTIFHISSVCLLSDGGVPMEQGYTLLAIYLCHHHNHEKHIFFFFILTTDIIQGKICSLFHKPTETTQSIALNYTSEYFRIYAEVRDGSS